MILSQNITAVLLAAGLGKRMNARIPKSMHLINNKPILAYILETLNKLNLKKIIIVTNPKDNSIENYIQTLHLKTPIQCVHQNKPLGTADALKAAIPTIKKSPTNNILVLPADCPNIQPNTILDQFHKLNPQNIALFTTTLQNPHGYGRIIRTTNSDIAEIIEEKDTNNEQKEIKEINTGIYIFPLNFILTFIDHIKPDNNAKEYYLTDLIKIAKQNNFIITPLHSHEYQHFAGVNTQEQLIEAQYWKNQNI